MSDELPRVYLTYEEAAKMMGCKSTRTIGRKVKAASWRRVATAKASASCMRAYCAIPIMGGTHNGCTTNKAPT